MANWKYTPYRNKKILDAARGEKCTICGLQDDTIVAAHSNDVRHGKGLGKKSDDCFVAFLCNSCHTDYDRKHKEECGEYMVDQQDFNLAMARTWKRLLEKGVLK